jgi:hypothetical protein
LRHGHNLIATLRNERLHLSQERLILLAFSLCLLALKSLYLLWCDGW